MNKYGQFKRTIMFFPALIILSALTGLFSYVWYTEYSSVIIEPFQKRGNWLVVAIYFVLLLFFSNIFGGLRVGYFKKSDVIYSLALSTVFVNAITYFQISLIGRWFLSILPMLYITIIDIVLIIIWEIASSALYEKLYPPRKMIIVYGGNRQATNLVYKMSTRMDKYQICASIKEDEGFEKIIERISGYQAVIICDVNSKFRNRLLKYCFENSIRAYITPKISDIIVRGAQDINLFDTPLLLCRNEGLSLEQRAVKRTLDLFISIITLIFASPFMLIIATAIKLYDGGPVFYKQERCTINEKRFFIYKFRSMIVNAEKDGKSMPAVDNDPRITPVGKIIRKIRMDELPQIFNVIKGDMSIVGPRPERIEHVEQYTQEIPEFKFRSKVKGGLTGYAQIFGKYNTSAYDKLKLDLMYINNYSIILDLKLILMTFKILLMKESTEGFNNTIPTHHHESVNPELEVEETN